MEPISGFVRAVVGDVAFVFGKGMVSAFLLARSKDRSRWAAAGPAGAVSRSVRARCPSLTGTVPAVDRLVGLEDVRPAPLLTVEFTPGDTGAEAHLTANNPVLITITDVSHREYDAVVLTTSLGGAAYAQLPPGYYHVSAVVIDEYDDVLQGYGAQHNLHVDKGDDLIVSLAIRTAGVGGDRVRAGGRTAAGARRAGRRRRTAPGPGADRACAGLRSDPGPSGGEPAPRGAAPDRRGRPTRCATSARPTGPR